MPRAAAGVEQFEFCQSLGPVLKDACRQCPAALIQFNKTQKFQGDTGNGGLLAQFFLACGIFQVFSTQTPGCPPCPQPIVQQKTYHVRFSEELGHGGQFACAYFDLGTVDALFVVCLPELVHPAQAVRSGEHLLRQGRQQAFQPLLMLRGQSQLKNRRVQPENLWQHAGSKAGGQLPAVGCTFIGGQVFTFFKRHRHRIIRVWIHQQIVLGQKAGKEHTVPVLVGDFFHQTIHVLHFIAVQGIPKLPAMRSQTAAQLALRLGKVRGHGLLVHAKLTQRGTGCGFRYDTRFPDGALQTTAEISVEGGHRLNPCSTVMAGKMCVK